MPEPSAGVLRRFTAGTASAVRQHVMLSYDGTGNLTEVRSQADLGADGTIDSSSLQRRTYHGAGQLVSTVVEVDADGDGQLEERTTGTFVYGCRRRTGLPTYAETQDLTYDSQGDVLTSAVAMDYDGDGDPAALIAVVNTYDALGRIVTSTSHSTKTPTA